MIETLRGQHNHNIPTTLPLFHCIGGLVVKLAVAIRDINSMIRPAPGSIPGRCMRAPLCCISFVLLSLSILCVCIRPMVYCGFNRIEIRDYINTSFGPERYVRRSVDLAAGIIRAALAEGTLGVHVRDPRLSAALY
jgi:hypothetical protein